MWQNNVYIFGGQRDKEFGSKTQISRFNGFQLERVGSLNFNFAVKARGTCTATKTEIFLCFDHFSNICRRASGPLMNFTEVTPSMFSHSSTQISASSGEWNSKTWKLRERCLICKTFYRGLYPGLKFYWTLLYTSTKALLFYFFEFRSV